MSESHTRFEKYSLEKKLQLFKKRKIMLYCFYHTELFIRNKQKPLWGSLWNITLYKSSNRCFNCQITFRDLFVSFPWSCFLPFDFIVYLTCAATYKYYNIYNGGKTRQRRRWESGFLPPRYVVVLYSCAFVIVIASTKN